MNDTAADPALAERCEQLRALVGRSGPTTHGRVERRDCVRFALAVDDPDPVYRDDDAARAAGYPAAIAPPLFVSSVQEWGAGLPSRELRHDGTGSERTGWLPLDGLRLMGGGQDLEFHRPVVTGTGVTITTRLDDVQLKHGRSGPLIVMTLTTVYRDEDGEPLVTCRETPLARAGE